MPVSTYISYRVVLNTLHSALLMFVDIYMVVQRYAMERVVHILVCIYSHYLPVVRRYVTGLTSYLVSYGREGTLLIVSSRSSYYY